MQLPTQGNLGLQGFFHQNGRTSQPLLKHEGDVCARKIGPRSSISDNFRNRSSLNDFKEKLGEKCATHQNGPPPMMRMSVEGSNDLEALEQRIDGFVCSYDNDRGNKGTTCNSSVASIGLTTLNSGVLRNARVSSPASSFDSLVNLTSDSTCAPSMPDWCSLLNSNLLGSSLYQDGLSAFHRHSFNDSHMMVSNFPSVSGGNALYWSEDVGASKIQTPAAMISSDCQNSHFMQKIGGKRGRNMLENPYSYQEHLNGGKPLTVDKVNSFNNSNLYGVRKWPACSSSQPLNICNPVSSLISSGNYQSTSSFSIPFGSAYDPAAVYNQLNLQALQQASQLSESILQAPQAGINSHQGYTQLDQQRHWKYAHQQQDFENGKSGLLQSENLLDGMTQMSGYIFPDQMLNFGQKKESSSQPCESSVEVPKIQQSSVSEEFKLRRKQNLLLLYEHVRNCSGQMNQCKYHHCRNMKLILKHMRQCNDAHCAQQCAQYKRVLAHYLSCCNNACPICSPVRVQLNVIKHSTIQMESKVNPTINIEPDEQPPLKQIKTDYPSLSHSIQGHITQTLIPSMEGSCLSMNSLVNVCQEDKPSLDAKTKSTDIVANPCTSSSQDSTAGYAGDKFDKPGAAVKVQLAVGIVASDVMVAQCDQEKVKLKPEVGSIKFDVQFNTTATLTDTVAKTNLEKTKIRGVSLVDFFSPGQVREHIKSLRSCINQSKEKEKYQGMHIKDDNLCSLCQMEKLLFDPPPRFCASCELQISPKGMYYITKASVATCKNPAAQRSICNKCFNLRGDSVKIVGEEDIPKESFHRTWNYAETDAEPESWVQCDKCKSWQHQVCALFNEKINQAELTEYTCPSCFLHEIESGVKKPLQKSRILGAKDLPTTKLSDHIEQWLFRRLKEERQERAHNIGKSFEEVPGAEDLVVRVVSSVDKIIEVKQLFRETFQEENYPSEFPYKSKAIMLFQKIDGADVCLFSMYAQEFSSECACPNQRRVCLSYIDSVKYFRPEIKTVTGEALRTFVYHQILIAYLDYCKRRGFISCYIWSCPPRKRDDYILYCHPESQKMPKADKLREWYFMMIRKAAKEKIVVDHTNLFDQFFVSPDCKAKISAARLPYFDGDFWPVQAENILHKNGNTPDNKGKKAAVERTLRAARREATLGNPKDILLMKNLENAIRPKEDFIMIHLHHSCKHCCQPILSGKLWACSLCKNFQLCEQCHDIEKNLAKKDRHPVNMKEKHSFHLAEVEKVSSETDDRDKTVGSEIFDTRLVFLGLCQGNNYQFGTLRRAKHSTMMVLYHMHTSLCKLCGNIVEPAEGWRCMICSDYNVCNSCYQRVGVVQHDHELVKRSVTGEPVSQNSLAQQKEGLQAWDWLSLLVHASKCSGGHCKIPNCLKVKKLFHHGVECQIRITGGCEPCKKMWYMLQCHSCACKESNCCVPRCRDLKLHLKKKLQNVTGEQQ